MKHLNKVVNVLLTIALYSSPAIVYAGGPGFKDDVKNWGDDDHDDDDGDDDSHTQNDDDHWNDDECSDDNYNDDDNYEIPLDGGLSFLAVAGAAYGIKRVRDRKAKK